MARMNVKAFQPQRQGRHAEGCQYEDQALQEVQMLLGAQLRKRDLPIEFLHLIQDEYVFIRSAFAGFGGRTALSMAEIYEVASFMRILTWSKKAKHRPLH